ncbi:Integral membrane sensor signal transduction histidine kinase [Mesotoga infera]|nr:Integral membrane sensor signal transduction histidine kinase [Mesotoga infera]
MSKLDGGLFKPGYHYIVGGAVLGTGLIYSFIEGFSLDRVLLIALLSLVALASVYFALVRQLERLVRLVQTGERKSIGELEGQFNQIYGFYRSLSFQIEEERNYYERLYRDYSELLNTLEISVASVDENGNFDLVNDAFTKSFSYGSQQGRYLRIDRFARRTGLIFPLQEGQYEVYSKKLGKRYLVSVVHKQKSGYLLTLTDMTSQWKTKQLLEKTRRYAVDAQTVADLAHGLKQPLANVRLALDLYRRTGKPEYIDTLEKELNAFQGRVGGILQIFRYGEEFDVVDLSEQVMKVATFMSSIFQERKIDFRIISLEKGLVLAQRGRLENVIKNLFMNAVEAGLPSETSIIAKVRASKEYLTLIVADTGKGIDPSNLQKVFKPFFSTKTEGSGLGLYLVHNFCEENDVRLKMRSVKGKGTVFVLTFRRQSDEAQSPCG